MERQTLQTTFKEYGMTLLTQIKPDRLFLKKEVLKLHKIDNILTIQKGCLFLTAPAFTNSKKEVNQ
jgi:hypothetical protein